MYRPSLRHAVLSTLLVLSGACTEGEPGTETPVAGVGSRLSDAGSGFTAGGWLTPAAGKQVPSSAKVMVIWSVSSSSPDYLYKFGEGSSSGSSFTLPLSTPPPPAAVNSGELGVGLIVLVPADYSLPDGTLSEESLGELSTQALGGAGQFAIIYKATATVTYWSWPDLFPVGYSCGRGVEALPESSHDTFEPVSCESLGITVDDLGNIEFMNWT